MEANEVSVYVNNPISSSQINKNQKRKKIIHQHYLVLKVLKDDIKGNVLKCFYIKGFFKWGICILKEGGRGLYIDKAGRDMMDKIQWQEQVHQELQNKVPIPCLIEAFDEEDSKFIAIKYIKGDTLGNLRQIHNAKLRSYFKKGDPLAITFVNHLLQVLDITVSLHHNGFVHRDITPENFIVSTKGNLHLIDLELSYSIQRQFPFPPFVLGSFGYMSPEQVQSKTPTIKEDIYALGSLLFKILTGIDPLKIDKRNFENTERIVNFFIDDKIIANLVLKCIQSIAEKRPSIETIKQELINYKTDILKKNKRPLNTKLLYSKEEITIAIQESIDAVASPIMTENKLWFSEDLQLNGINRDGGINKALYIGFYRGVSGVLYTLSIAKKMGFNIEGAHPYIKEGMDHIDYNIINNGNNIVPGLYFGGAGVAICLTTAMQCGLLEVEPKLLDWISNLLSKENNAINLMHGISGQGLAYLRCNQYCPSEIFTSHLDKYAELIINCQMKDGSWMNERDKKNKLTSGFGHGVSGIIYFLLEYGAYFKSPKALQVAERGLNWLKIETSKHGVGLPSADPKRHEMGRWWCEGNVGIVQTYLKAHQILQEAKYGRYAREILMEYDKDIIDNNLSQCHGLSGLGEIYLEAFTILQDSEWLERSGHIAQVLMHLKLPYPQHGSYWLVQKTRQPTADFMTGCSGIIHFLLRYINANKIGYPLLT